MINKKAISPVITTVLLIMISIAAVAIVASVVFPLFNPDEGECFKAVGQIDIDTSSKYTCYYIIDPTAAAGDEYAVVNVSIKRGAEPLGIEQFIIMVYGEGRNERFEIKKEIRTDTKILMYGAATLAEAQDIKIPERREMMTYSLTTTLGEVTSMEISPVIKGNIFCNAADRQVIEMC
ncbi:hypothetical protein A3K73_07430 [Candidatus Pacearchaeota archaeon RBG_13_36_9]|nr:MAG: hypothetical protein A3K73_07430 [Candidatus Pacearchaeota archaeon RBG_13_36_9]